MHRAWTIFLLFGCVLAIDIDLGNECVVDENQNLQYCEYDIVLGQNAPCEDSGTIQTPNYPGSLDSSQPDRRGTYKFRLSACPGSIVSILVHSDAFKLSSQRNTFRVGDGDVYDSNVKQPVLSGQENGNELPSGDSQLYEGKSNNMWVEFKAPDAGAFFKIEYSISMSVIFEHTFTDASDWINSSYFSPDEPYPQGVEYRYFIDTTQWTEGDLLLTVDSFSITGSYDFGDYLLMGPGLDREKSKASALLSWSLPSNTRFLISGNTAYLVFKTSKQSDTTGYKGFSIRYQVISKNLTTPAPPTTTLRPPTTPIPLDISSMEADLVVLNVSETLKDHTLHTIVAELVNDYLSESNSLGNGWNLLAPITDSSVKDTSENPCYAGWPISRKVCAQFTLYVESFKSNGTHVMPTFLRKDIEAAVRKSNYYDEQITLPGDLVDIYFWAVIIAAAVALVVLASCLLMWRMRLVQHYRDQKKYSNLRTSNSDSKNGVNLPGPSAVLSQGIDNPNFVNDEFENVVTFNPENRTLHSRSGAYGFVPARRQSRDRNSSSSDAESNTSSHRSVPSQLPRTTETAPNPPPRGILKRTVVQPMGSPILQKEPSPLIQTDIQPESTWNEAQMGGLKRTVVPPMESPQKPTRSSLRRTVVPPLQEPKRSSLRRTIVQPMQLPASAEEKDVLKIQFATPSMRPTSGQNNIIEEEMEEVSLRDSEKNVRFPSPQTSEGSKSNQDRVVNFYDIEGRGSINETDL